MDKRPTPELAWRRHRANNIKNTKTKQSMTGSRRRNASGQIERAYDDRPATQKLQLEVRLAGMTKTRRSRNGKEG